ncbi:hypothetical protein [Photobacterium sp. 1_MG-2023]|uniref:hypothetical protein n=1 Tax=Photobacterium sp. 1_MG-2023 TaxID=3062646 RepID=UPI0026E146A1|nr:hypothetical protein [Photobacterium sp. 1_MG-2023]MDO6708926.1 hypothetical protein [Photobacterium sp. 1_MG-2023]
MKTKRLNNLVLAAVTVLMAGCADSPSTINEQTREARNNLKNYALASCLIAVDPDSKLAEDLKLTKRSLSFMGNGNYKIVQNEETFETENEPYNETVSFLMSEANRSIGYMKDGSSSRTYGCFKAAQSDVFDEFIAGQDEFIRG